MIKIKIITPENIGIIESAAGHSLLDILRKGGYNIYAPCGGKGTCGKCSVKLKDIILFKSPEAIWRRCHHQNQLLPGT